MERAHGIRMLRARLQLEDGPPGFDRFRPEPDQLSHRRDRLVPAQACGDAINQPGHDCRLFQLRCFHGVGSSRNGMTADASAGALKIV